MTVEQWNINKHGTPEYAPQYGIYKNNSSTDFCIVRGVDAKSDAQLIAAAPALLKALEAWQKYDSEAADKHPCPDYALRTVYRDNARKLTEAAIALAEKKG